MLEFFGFFALDILGEGQAKQRRLKKEEESREPQQSGKYGCWAESATLGGFGKDRREGPRHGF